MAYPPQQQQPLTRQQRFDEQDRADQEFANQQQALRIQQQRADADEVGQAMQMRQFGQQSLYQQQQMAEAQRASARADELAQRQKAESDYAITQRGVTETHNRLINEAARAAVTNQPEIEKRAAQTSAIQKAENERQAAVEKRAADAEALAIKQKEANLAYTQAAADKTSDEIKHYYDTNAINAQQASWLMNLKTPEERRENLANMLDRLSSAKAAAPTGTSGIAAQIASADETLTAQTSSEFIKTYGVSPDSSHGAQVKFKEMLEARKKAATETQLRDQEIKGIIQTRAQEKNQATLRNISDPFEQAKKEAEAKFEALSWAEKEAYYRKHYDERPTNPFNAHSKFVHPRPIPGHPGIINPADIR